MADRHKQEIQEILERARQTSGLLEIAGKSCSRRTAAKPNRKVVSAFVVDLFAEASRNPHVAQLVRDVL